jgi:predicted RNase H-like HicB family nuclease
VPHPTKDLGIGLVNAIRQRAVEMSDNRFWYVMAIEQGDARHAWSVHFPDLPGCFSAGDTMQDAVTNARDAVLLFIEDRLERGEPLPGATSLDDLKHDRRYSGPRWTWMPAYLDVDELIGPAQRVNVMIPRTALARIDAAAARAAQTRSAYMVEAALAFVTSAPPAKTKGKSRRVA